MPTSQPTDWTALHKKYTQAKDLPLPPEWRRVEFRSSADDSNQGAFFYAPPESNAPVPLLVLLHPWSADREVYHPQCVRWCIDKGWAAIAPDFRGANSKPAACGSELAVGDVASAVEWARARARVDANRIYLLGTSGGGHMALLMAGRRPEIWAGVSAWVPISDLAAWHRQQSAAGGPPGGYAKSIETCCGGPPGASKEVDEQYRTRSPLTWLPEVKKLGARAPAIDINAGIRDGRAGSVPISHSLNAFNALAADADRVAEADIAHMTEKSEVPAALCAAIDDPSYGKKKPLFRRVSGPFRVTIFDGSHEFVPVAALTWLEKQLKK